MNKKQYLGGKNNFKTSLVLSVIVLIALFILIFIQIFRLKNSGNAIIANVKNTMLINKLLDNALQIEDQFQNNQITTKSLSHFKIKSDSILQNLKLNALKPATLDAQYANLYQLFLNKLQNKANTKDIQKEINTYETTLFNWHKTEVNAGINRFEYENSFLPKVFLISTTLGFIIFVLALLKIIEVRRLISKKSSILDSILENTNDVANFYEPVYDDKNNLKDFIITYASKANITLTDIPFKDIQGRLVSETYPFLKGSGLFGQLMSAYENQQYFEKLLEIPIKNEVRYFNARYIPVKSGLQVMVTEMTKLFSKQEEIEQSNNALSLKNRLFHEAEEVAKLGSYVWYMDADYTQMSDNVYRILECEPQSFEMSAAKFREFVHKGDLEHYDQELNNAYEKEVPIETFFRVVTTTSKVKNIYTKGDFGQRDGENTMIGVIQDVSDRLSTENELKKQNIKLKARNAELDSFNRVVSHDLQEPLRKIQMFISRISEEDETINNNPQRKKYFEKINNAATRMRKLINNLLSFSRVDNKDYTLETINLNETLNDVLENFTETKAFLDSKINIAKLPTLKAIPFLMEQLFTNIISNAIKYRALDKNLVINIEHKKIAAEFIKEEFIKTYYYYHCFKITDNGIGFEDSESEKIFDLFYRLHSKSEYSGTGLGLAICKKIVIKHQGFITSKSSLGNGTSFIIYLPENLL